MVEPAYASLTVEPAFASSPYGRAPPDLISRAPKGPMVERLRTLSVEHLKVMAASRACLRILFNLLIWLSNK